MIHSARRGVTRSYVVGLVGAVIISIAAFLVAGWGALSLASGTDPVQTIGVPYMTAPVLVAVLAVGLVVLLWREALALLKGRQTPPIATMVISGFGAYLLWCVAGSMAGLAPAETWLSGYAAILAVLWALAPLILWAILMRRLYTDRSTPQWPWEKHPAPGDLQYPDHPVNPADNPQNPEYD